MLVRIGDSVYERDAAGALVLFAVWTHGAWYRESLRTSKLVEMDVVSDEDARRCAAATVLEPKGRKDATAAR